MAFEAGRAIAICILIVILAWLLLLWIVVPA